MILMNVSKLLTDYLTQQYIPQGMEIYEGKSPEKIKKLFENKKNNIILFEGHNFLGPWVDLLVQLKEQEKPHSHSFSLIMLTDSKDKDFLQMLMFFNPIGVISSKLSNEEILSKLNHILKEQAYQYEMRQNVRITPSESDQLTMNINIPNVANPAVGKVINISIGGAAIQFEGKAKTLGIGEGEYFRCQLLLNRKILLTEIKVVFVKDQFIGVQFLRASDSFYNSLGRYILEKLSE